MNFSRLNSSGKLSGKVALTVISYCLLIAFSYSAFIGVGSDLLNNKKSTNSGIHHQHSPSQPLDTPFDSDTTPTEAEYEKDLKDSLDDEWSKVFCFIENALWSNHANVEISFSQHARSVQNRPTLSLFVLHHAWKSFLI